MFDRIVIAVDRPGRASEVAPAAKMLAPGARIVLVHVYPMELPSTQAIGPQSQDAMRLLEQERRAANLPEAVSHVVLDRSAAQGLARACAPRDVLVIGAPTENPPGQLEGDDVARNIFHIAPCPVLVVPRGGRGALERPLSIGVAVDGSPESGKAAAYAAQAARETGASLLLLHVHEVRDAAPPDALEGGGYTDTLAELERSRLREIAAAVDMPCDLQTARGVPAQELVALARRCDLVVCGSRGWSPAARDALGSVTDQLVARSDTPVLVVTRRAGARARAFPTSPHEIAQAVSRGA